MWERWTPQVTGKTTIFCRSTIAGKDTERKWLLPKENTDSKWYQKGVRYNERFKDYLCKDLRKQSDLLMLSLM